MPYYPSKKSFSKASVTPVSTRAPFNRRKWGTIAAILFLIGAVIFAAWRYWPVSAPDPAKDFAAATRFAASSDFRRLSPQAQREFMSSYRTNAPKDRSQRPELSEDQRHQLRANMGRMGMAMMAERAKEYLALSPADKVAYIKKQTEQMNEWMRNRPQMPGGDRGNGPRPGPPQGQGNTPPPQGDRGPNRRLQMFKDTTPTERAEVSAYMRALFKARGNQFPGRR